MPVENEHFVAEALRIVEEAEAQGIKLRILGSLAYRIHCPQNIEMFTKMERALTDIDFAGEKRQSKQIKQFLTASGYVEDERMTVSTEGSRYYFEHPDTKLGVDVFMNELYFCHRIPFDGRLDLDRPTISTADLLLEKMQIVEINLKDFKDTVVLMLEHPLSNEQKGPKSIDVDYIIGMMRQDWGFYYTFTTNLKRVPEHFSEFPSILEDQRGVISGRIAALLDAIEAAPKTIGWKMRSKIGTRSRWYQEVSEKSEQY